MTDEDSQGKKKNRGSKNKSKGKSPPKNNRNSVASSSSQNTQQKNQGPSRTVKVLKRASVSEPVAPEPRPLMSDDMKRQPRPLIVSDSTRKPSPLMSQEVKKPTTTVTAPASGETSSEATTPKTRKWKTHEELSHVASRHSEANKKQTNAYYFSDRPGTAVSADAFQESVQYTMQSFPLERNVPISIERKYSLLITPTSTRVNAIFVRVKSQNADDSLATGALLDAEADEQTIREACCETIQNFKIAKSPSDRYPFSKCSEKFLFEHRMVRLVEPLLAFPEAIYYCEKCDYHINTINHAKSHLESSSHLDDVERQTQRERLLEKIPVPTKQHYRAIENVLNAQLRGYERTRQQAHERTEMTLVYLNQVIDSVGCPNAILKPFGSSTYDVMLENSDFNVAITATLSEGTAAYTFLEKIRKKICDDGWDAEHAIEMGSASMCQFKFKGQQVNLFWMSSFDARPQLSFTQLMQTYVSLRPEVVQFLRLVRLWAQMAQLDSKNKSRIGLPLFGFDIMAIHYLQMAGMLPVLHELYEPETDGVQDVAPEEKEKDAKLPEEANRRRMRLMSMYPKDPEKIGKKFDLGKPWHLAELWLGFLSYFIKGHREIVVQITQSSLMKRDANKWSRKILHVVDPFRGDNVLTIPKVSSWLPFFFNCLLTTYLSFVIPVTEQGPVVDITLYLNKATSSKKKIKEAPASTAPPPPVVNAVPFPPLDSKTLEDSARKEQDEINAQADAYIEEMEHGNYEKVLCDSVRFDGIPLSRLKPEDVEIDDHLNHQYSSRTMRRVRRVLPQPLPSAELTRLQSFGCFSRKGIRHARMLAKKMTIEEGAEEKAAEAGKEDVVERVTERMKDVALVGSVMTTRTVMMSASDPPSPGERSLDGVRVPQCDVSCSPTHMTLYTITPPYCEEQRQNEPEDVESVKLGPGAPTVEKTPPSCTIQNQTTPSSTFGKPPFESTLTPPAANTCTEEFFIRENFDETKVSSSARHLETSDFHFEFNTTAFCGGYEMEIKCTHCDGNHCVDDCPMMQIPPIEKFPPRSEKELKDIDAVIDRYFADNILRDSRLSMLQNKVDDLEKRLQKFYRPDVKLTIFGSVMTGLSVNCSDIDICLRFGEGDDPPKDLDPKKVIATVGDLLRRCHLAKRVLPIVAAKVPIVKCQLKLSNEEIVDADISYYNILALYNTRLLKEYSLWTPDNRFAKLALFVKHWAKSCDIGDASRGSLSSYAHTIMLISYLQQCDPPVLPRLQEDFRSENHEQRIIENWDTAFVNGEPELLATWQRNRESCAQLLIGYFDHFSRFSYRNFVIQCRREAILSKIEKDWPRALCVEDPFDLSHNLSSGVSKKMFVFIMKVFISSRAAFMSVKPVDQRGTTYFPYAYKSQLFRACSQGTAPADRQCHYCHRVGHFAESCPLKVSGNRRRQGSNTTNSSYRSNGANFGDRGGDGPGNLMFHKRPVNRRTYL